MELDDGRGAAETTQYIRCGQVGNSRRPAAGSPEVLPLAQGQTMAQQVRRSRHVRLVAQSCATGFYARINATKCDPLVPIVRE